MECRKLQGSAHWKEQFKLLVCTDPHFQYYMQVCDLIPKNDTVETE